MSQIRISQRQIAREKTYHRDKLPQYNEAGLCFRKEVSNKYPWSKNTQYKILRLFDPQSVLFLSTQTHLKIIWPHVYFSPR